MDVILCISNRPSGGSMQGSTVPSKTVFFLPLWIRIGMASLFFAVTVLLMWKHFLQFEWVPWFCFGLYYLTYVPRQKDEAIGTYFTRPRSIAPMVLLLSAIAGFGYNLYILYAK
jgi:hypothetical protein